MQKYQLPLLRISSSIAVAGLAAELDLAANGSHPRCKHSLGISHKRGRWIERGLDRTEWANAEGNTLSC